MFEFLFFLCTFLRVMLCIYFYDVLYDLCSYQMDSIYRVSCLLWARTRTHIHTNTRVYFGDMRKRTKQKFFHTFLFLSLCSHYHHYHHHHENHRGNSMEIDIPTYKWIRYEVLGHKKRITYETAIFFYSHEIHIAST